MNVYAWRNIFHMTCSEGESLIVSKLAVKTREIDWLETNDPVIVLVSIYSTFHERIWGEFKMNALISSIKSHVKGKITVLFADGAHLQTHSLDHDGNVKKAFEETIDTSYQLQKRYRSYLAGCDVVDWHTYICQDVNYSHFLASLKKLSKEDRLFYELLQKDAEETYTCERREKFMDKDLFMKKTMEDLLEQYAALAVLANRGYRYLFYPGKPHLMFESIKNIFFQKMQMSWINVFLTIERKKTLSTS